MSLDLSRFSSLSTLLVLAVAACGGGGDDDGGDGISAQCQEATQHSDLEWIQENIFDVSCSLSPSCHQGGASEAQGLNLEPGMSEGNMLNVPAMGDSADGLDLVEPGDPASSYLLIIMGQFGEDDPRIPEATGPMPYNSGLLCPEKRDAIERWIEML